jgi:hypothetical protein
VEVWPEHASVGERVELVHPSDALDACNIHPIEDSGENIRGHKRVEEHPNVAELAKHMRIFSFIRVKSQL